jgi:hypothetical protein
MAWLGLKKLILVPVYRPNALPPDVIPPDWPNLILRRMLFDLDHRREDVSLRTYIYTVSSGRADLSAVVQPMETVNQQDVPPNYFESTLGPLMRQQGYDAAAIVMLGGLGAGTNAGYWSRFVMVEQVGVWAMEFMHGLTGFGDLYPFNGNMGAFDEMACSCGVHPSAFTKRAIGWIDAKTVARHIHGTGEYQLYSISRRQPAPNNQCAAVQIGDRVPYLMVEARQKVDQFDSGIPSEGVIVYKVQTTDPLGHPATGVAPIKLLTPTALTVGQFYQQGVTFIDKIIIEVKSQSHTGFHITVITNNLPFINAPEEEERPDSSNT